MRNLRVLVAPVMLASLAMPAFGFKDPLETPALVSTVAAPSGRLTAVANAGSRLVAVGPRGRILLSDKEGREWRQVPVPVSSDLVAVQFPTPEKGWAVGHDGVVLHTDDGGQTWIKQLDGKQAAKLIQTYFEKRAAQGDAEAANLMGEVGRFVAEGADKPFLDVLFLNEREGFIVGAFNLSFRTTDAGTTWTPLNHRTDNPNGLHMYALANLGGEVYLAGEQGLLRRWNRHKERFEAVASPYKGSYFGMIAKDAALIVFGMRGNVYRSADRGASWTKMNNTVSEGITGGAFLANGRVVLATQSGKLLMNSENWEGFMAIKASHPMPYFGIAPMGADRVALVGAQGVRIESAK